MFAVANIRQVLLGQDGKPIAVLVVHPRVEAGQAVDLDALTRPHDARYAGPWYGGDPKLLLLHPADLEHLWTLMVDSGKFEPMAINGVVCPGCVVHPWLLDAMNTWRDA